jgi:predicted nucleotidyltransferase
MSVIKEIAQKTGEYLNEIFSAEKLTQENFKKISDKISVLPIPIASTDVDLVVFGSIARNECTTKSDVDWTLLIDGQASSDHLQIAHSVEESIVATGLAEPGKSGMFGQITFSHDLIHYIGGQDDTNHNLSRRILLLLESENVFHQGKNEGTAMDRVIRGVLAKYILNDSGYAASSRKENVPRFLLNDIIRFWRTMCVDFAYKQIEQKGQKWALRNIKLRMSRRLIFIKGLLMCARIYNTSLSPIEIIGELSKFVSQTPLEFMVSSFLHFDISEKEIVRILKSYDTYLKMLNDKEFREALEKLDMYEAYGNKKFEEARDNSHIFQESLNNIFIRQSNKISEFTLKYGVF